MPDSPLEVCLGVSLDEGVDGADTSVSLGGMVSGGLMISRGRGRVLRWNFPPHSSLNWMICLSLKCEHMQCAWIVHHVDLPILINQSICRNLICESGSAIGGLGRSVGRGVMDRLLGAHMVVVKVMLSMTLIAIVPLKLGPERVVLL